MKKTQTRTEKLKHLLHILIPIFITQLGMFALNFFDTTMSGHYSSNDLAGVAIGSSIWVPVFTGLSGILFSITPIVSQLIGGNKTEKVSFSVIQALYLATFIAIIVILAGYLFLNPLLNNMHIQSSVQYIAKEYLIGLSFGIIPLFVYNVIRSFIDALGKTSVSMMITMISIPINLLINYMLIFGKFGFPELGGAGAGYATAITYWVITILAAVILHKLKPFAAFKIFRRFYRVSFTKWKEILLIGVPIGFAIFFETSIFSAVTLLMSNFSTATIASHQAAINFSTALYMIPLSISMALTIVVGFEIGAGRYQDAKAYSILGIAIALVMSTVSGLALFFLRDEIASLYSDDPFVQNLTAQFLLYAIFFQLSDALQAPIQGALRGYKDVNMTFVMALISYWLIGLPLGYYFANHTSTGPYGYWIGLIIGLGIGAICLSIRLIFIQKKHRLINQALKCS